jgi:protease I
MKRLYPTLRVALLAVFGLSLTLAARAQSDEDQLKATLNNYLDGIATGDTTKMGRSLYGQANLRSLNARGEISNMPVRKFISATPAGGSKGATRIVSYSFIGTAGTAVVEWEYKDFRFVDFLALLKTDAGWRIVSRVYANADKGTPIVSTGGGKTLASSAKKPVAKKPKSDDGWD